MFQSCIALEKFSKLYFTSILIYLFVKTHGGNLCENWFIVLPLFVLYCLCFALVFADVIVGVDLFVIVYHWALDQHS